MLDHTKRERVSRLLIVEDDKSQLRTLTDLMGEEGFEVIACGTAAEALNHVTDPDFSVAIVDLRLPDLSGTELLEKMRQLNGQVQVIIHTGYGSYDSAKEALNLGAFAYVEKLGHPSELIGHVHRAFLDAKRTEAEVARRARTLINQIQQALELDAEFRAWRAMKDETAKRLSSLTPRERSVVERITSGMTTKGIAAEFGITTQAIDAPRNRAMKKLNVRTVSALAVLVAGAEQR